MKFGTITDYIVRGERTRTLLRLTSPACGMPSGVYRLIHATHCWQEQIHTGDFHNVIGLKHTENLDRALNNARSCGRLVSSRPTDSTGVETREDFTINA